MFDGLGFHIICPWAGKEGQSLGVGVGKSGNDEKQENDNG